VAEEAAGPGDRHTVRIGGSVAGPVVVGRGNHVEVTQPPPPPAPEDGNAPGAGTDPGTGPGAGASEGEGEGSTQNNSATGHGTVYTVMNGDLHVHHPDDAGT